MLNYTLAENISEYVSLNNAKAKIKAHKIKKSIDKPFRVYTIDNQSYTGKGYWIERKKLFKDRIKFIQFKNYQIAKKEAKKILANTQEIAISIEDISKNILYVVYKDKTVILKIKSSFKTTSKRQAILYVKKLNRVNGGSTLEIKSKSYIITSYK